ARFREEFPEPEQHGPTINGALAGGWRGERGVLRAGRMHWEESVGWVYPGPRVVPAAGSGVLEGRLDASAAAWLSASALPRWTEAGVDLAEAYVALDVAGIDAWVGRRGLALGPGIVLSGAVALDGAAVAAAGEGVRLPGP